MVADKCNRCGKIVVKLNHYDSSDMVETCDSFLYLCDIKAGDSGRPSLQLKEYCGGTLERQSHMYCLDCLDATVAEWVEEMKKRGKSNIPLSHILLPNRPVSSPCPICGK